MASQSCKRCGSDNRDKWGHCRPCARRGASARYHRSDKSRKSQQRRAWYLANKEKVGQQSRRWAEENPELRREVQEKSRLRKYGMTTDQYKAMLADQGGTCRICTQTLRESSTHIDHDHATGRVRGLLCQKCNVGLGHFRDNPEILRCAAIYLESQCTAPDVGSHRLIRRRKVTEVMVSEIQRLRSEGCSLSVIAQTVGLSRAWVQVILRSEANA